VACLATAAVFALGLPAMAGAHSELEISTPADGATVPSPFDGPITLEFSAALADGSKADLLGPDGATIASASVDRPGATMTFTLDGALAVGEYQVKWTTVAEDTDVARGTVGFSVAPAPPTPSPTASPTPAPTAEPSASPPPTPSPEPASAAPSPAPSATPSTDGDATGSGSDVVLPIVVALIVVGAGAAYLFSRRNRPSASG
jgi:methionine-rich copper-binding protein CopC